MRRLAVELGSGATSIYRHVRDKDELINLAFDEVTGEIELPERGTGWEHALVAAARGLRDLFHRHRNFVTVIGRRSALGPHSLEIIERLVGILRESGLADRAAYQAVSAVIHYAVGFTILEIIPGLGGPSGATPEYRLLLNRYLDALPADAYPNSLAVAPLMIGKDDEDFDYGVHAIVAGIRALELLDTTRSR